ncbi:MAG: type III PLP-dependent enzyme [Rhodospirillaceae bacterium]|nr:type III PLP-dependent enzyme [Rhodospirillaceae bacterium]
MVQFKSFEKTLTGDIPEDLFRTVDEVAKRLKPEAPVQCVFPESIRTQARAFLGQFPGEVLYAVKCNPGPEFLRHMYEAGIRHFDVASLDEVRLVKSLFPQSGKNGGVGLHFMHPVKSRESIRAAYKLGVRTFSLDSVGELMKILEETKSAKDLNLFIRLAVSGNVAAYDLSGKFGAAPSVAADLLRHARKVAHKLGVCFHVGSQCMDPIAYTAAIGRAAQIIGKAKVKIDVLDVGGGFPATYPNMTPPPLADYMAAITTAAAPLIAEGGVAEGAQLWCEPGRAMVAAAGAMLVRVTLRKGRRLYINDGTYGSLFDAGALNWRFPVRLVRPLSRSGKNSSTPNTRLPSDKLVPFVFYGPTCDSLDKMKGPFLLPEDTQEGDWIEIGMLGAYGSAMQTRFNGFYSGTAATVWPEALAFTTQRRRAVLREVPRTHQAPQSRSEGQPAQLHLVDAIEAAERSDSQGELSADGHTDSTAIDLK